MQAQQTTPTMAKAVTSPTRTTKTTTKPSSATSTTTTKKVVSPPMKQDAMLQVFGFTQSTCTFCMKSIDDCNGLLMQCGKCRKVYFCSKKCFNDNVVTHQETCTTSAIR